EDDTLLQGSSLSPELVAAFKGLDCTKSESTLGSGGDDANSAIVTCDRIGSARYILAAAQVVGRDIQGATAALDQQNASGWVGSLDFTGDGTTKFGALTLS
ncbi:MAG: protein translocase subunit SecD, partial [bacterium]